MVVSIEYAHKQEFITPELIPHYRLQTQYFCIMCNCGSFHWLGLPFLPSNEASRFNSTSINDVETVMPFQSVEKANKKERIYLYKCSYLNR